MNTVKSIIFKFPILSSIVILLGGIYFTEIHFADSLSRFMDLQNATYLVGFIEQGTFSAFLVILIIRLGILQEVGFTSLRQWKNLWLIWPVFFYYYLNGGSSLFDGTFTLDASQPVRLGLFGLYNLSTGFFEEILFRGLILTLFLRKWGDTRKGIYWSVLLSSSIFGIAHLINLIMGRQTLLSTVSQISFGIFFGVFFAACRLRNQSIWPVILGHALFNICGRLQQITVGSTAFGKIAETSAQSVMITVVITLPLLLYGLLILRKSRPDRQVRLLDQVVV